MSGGKSLRSTTFHIVGGHKVLDAMMKSEGSRPTGLNNSDFIIFMGGTDINPEIYGEKPHTKTGLANFDRDRIEVALYKSTPKQFRVGICRGAQLLHALNGGTLWQHVEGHIGNHELSYTTETGVTRTYKVSSTHHQMMRKGGATGEVWGVANQTKVRQLVSGGSFAMAKDHWSDLEIVRYKATNTLCFQPHPEIMSPRETRELFYRCLSRMVET